MFDKLLIPRALNLTVLGLLFLFMLFSGLLVSQWNNFHYLLFLLGAVVAYREGFNLLKEQKVIVFAGFGLFFLSFVSLAVNDHYEKIFGYRFSVLIPLIFLPFYFALFNRTAFTIEQLWKVVILAGLYTVVYDILLFTYNPVRGTGLLETPITRGNLGMLFSVLALVAFWGLKSKLWKALALVVFFSGLLLSLKSGSRGGWLTLLTVYFTLIWVKYHFNKTQLYQLIILGIVLIVVVTASLPNLPLIPRIEQTWVNVSKYLMNGDYVSSIGYRFEMWKAALMGVVEKPLFGWGFNSFDDIFSKFRGLGLVGGVKGHLWGHPHNDYMLLLSELGVIGFTFAMSLLIYPAVIFVKGIKLAIASNSQSLLYLSLTGLVLVEAIMEFMLSDQTFTMRFPFHIYLILIVALMTLSIKAQEASGDKP